MNKHKQDKHQEDQNKMTDQKENKSENIEKNEEPEATAFDKAETKIAELELQVKDWQDKLLRKAAEFENFKRRTENDQFNLINYAAESFIIKLLPIVDDFERSIEHIEDVFSLNIGDKIGLDFVHPYQNGSAVLSNLRFIMQEI